MLVNIILKKNTFSKLTVLFYLREASSSPVPVNTVSHSGEVIRFSISKLFGRLFVPEINEDDVKSSIFLKTRLWLYYPEACKPEKPDHYLPGVPDEAEPILRP